MCGITGYLSCIRHEENWLLPMLDAIKHRGPDGHREYHHANYHVGMCRLAINDTTHGQQPLFNTSRTVSVMYNGEIYNSPQLRKLLQSKGYQFRTNSDGEVICHLYDEYGEDLFSYLDGMFAIALWDEKKRCLLLARDTAGEKPLYYASLDKGGIVFASEIKAIRRFPNLTLNINRQAIWDFPTFLWIPEPSTVYTEIKALERGHILKIDVSGITINRYNSHLDSNTSSDVLNDREIIEETRRVVDEAVRSRLLSDVPIGSFLSGGLDSSIVASLATRELGTIDTFSVAFEKLSDPYHGISDESEQAAAFARQLGSNHHTIRVTAHSLRESLDQFCYHGDQPFSVSSGLGILAVAEAAKKAGIKVLLSGDCADECFGGYSWYYFLQHTAALQCNTFEQDIVSFQNFGLSTKKRLELLLNYTPQQRAWAWHYYAHEQEKASLFAVDWREGLNSSLRHFSDFDKSPNWAPEQFVAHDRSFYLPNEMLCKLDRMTMAHSVEGRAPFAAPAVLALADRLPFSQMVRDGSLKWALRKAYADILPTDIIERPKHGFNVPIDHWLKDEWHDLVEEAFTPGSALHEHGILDNKSATNAERMLYDKNRLNGHTIFSFIVLNRWLEKFA